ncbi:MAG: hypothetical protein VZQ62_02720 [Methanosphaera sp.]|nr:hypothetical protein [Methanosphaera sp.]
MIKNINEITVDSYDKVRYLLSSELRLKTLRVLLESDMTLEGINEYIDKQDTNLLRTLKELQDINLVSLEDKVYSLTSAGYLVARNVMSVLDNWQTISKYSRCINYHSFKKFPLEFSRYMFMLDESERIESPSSDIYKTRRLYGEQLKESTDLKIILPIYSKQYLKYIFDTVKNNNADIQIITSRNIYEAIKQSKFADDVKKYRHEGNVRIFVTEDDVHEIFLTLTDKGSSISFFFKDNTFDDTTFFWKEEFKSKKMLGHFFEAYKYKMLSKEVI